MPKVEPFEYQKSTNIDEHNQIVNKINEIVDTSNDMEQKVNDAVDLVNELDKEVDKATSDISQLKISDAEHTEQITHLDTVVDNHATEITALKAKDATIDTEISSLKTKDTQHDAEIQGLSESVVTDLVATFDNSSRKLSLSIEREQAESIDAVVTIPAGGGGSGGSYSAGDGIAISDANVISVDDTVGKKSEIVALQNATKPAIKAIEVSETAEKVSITTTALDDATKITEDIGVVSDTKAGIVTPELKKKWDSSATDDTALLYTKVQNAYVPFKTNSTVVSNSNRMNGKSYVYHSTLTSFASPRNYPNNPSTTYPIYPWLHSYEIESSTEYEHVGVDVTWEDLTQIKNTIKKNLSIFTVAFPNTTISFEYDLIVGYELGFSSPSGPYCIVKKFSSSTLTRQKIAGTIDKDGNVVLSEELPTSNLYYYRKPDSNSYVYLVLTYIVQTYNE